ncbi:LysR substrate-binding domain-containing protein [Sandaracinobacteroides sp. A072]|uniref:LysR substrate-binding domain-containing protein n=1 Tax=Sandaracinobacteroides sp. A072 TaxID=3461146 RepID=UPI004042A6D8
MPHRRNIDIDLLRSFVTIVEVRSFTRAAERLLRTQSAISLQMKRLEEQLECRLFERGGRGVEPTQAGILLLGYARRILGANDELVGRMAEPMVEGRVIIGSPEGFATEHLVAVVARFSRAFPRVHMCVRAGGPEELAEALSAQDIDLLIECHVEEDAPGTLLMHEPLQWCVADGAEPEVAHEVPGEPLRLVVHTDPCPVRQVMMRLLDQIGLERRIVYETQSRSGVQAAVGAGLGVGVLPRSSLQAGMHRLNHAEGLPSLPDLRVLLQRRAELDPAAERFHGFLLNVFGASA